MKILIIGADNYGAGGRSIIVYNLLKEIHNSEMKFDFISTKKCSKDFEEAVGKLNGKIHYISLEGNFFIRNIIYAKDLFHIIRKNKYSVTHINADNCFESLKNVFLSKIAKTKNVIVHAHNTSSINVSKLKDLFTKFTQKLLSYFNYSKIACSQDAANFLFGEKHIDNLLILKNGINCDLYKFDERMRLKIRKQFNLENTFVYGFVGRLEKQKNPFFLLEVFKKIKELDSNTKLLIVGDGSLKNKMIEKTYSLGINNDVIFLGNRNDTYKLYQCMDAFLLPSFFEGFGIVNIEAQASGLPCFVSEAIPKLAKVNDNFYRLKSYDIDYWANFIINTDKIRENEYAYKKIKDMGFDISDNAKILEKNYLSLKKKNRV